MNSSAGKLYNFGNFGTGGARQFRNFTKRLRARSNDNDNRALLLRLPGVLSGNARKLVFQRGDFRLEVKIERMNIRGRDSSKGILPGYGVIGDGEYMRQFDISGVSAVRHMYYGDKIKPQKREIIQIILSNRLAVEMRMHKAQSPKTAAAAHTAKIGQIKARRVSKNDALDNAFAREKNAGLPPEFKGKRGQILCQLRRNRLPRRNPAPEHAFQRAPLRLLNS
jgi:hypothetical protein